MERADRGKWPSVGFKKGIFFPVTRCMRIEHSYVLKGRKQEREFEAIRQER